MLPSSSTPFSIFRRLLLFSFLSSLLLFNSCTKLSDELAFVSKKDKPKSNKKEWVLDKVVTTSVKNGVELNSSVTEFEYNENKLVNNISIDGQPYITELSYDEDSILTSFVRQGEKFLVIPYLGGCWAASGPGQNSITISVNDTFQLNHYNDCYDFPYNVIYNNLNRQSSLLNSIAAVYTLEFFDSRYTFDQGVLKGAAIWQHPTEVYEYKTDNHINPFISQRIPINLLMLNVINPTSLEFRTMSPTDYLLGCYNSRDNVTEIRSLYNIPPIVYTYKYNKEGLPTFCEIATADYELTPPFEVLPGSGTVFAKTSFFYKKK